MASPESSGSSGASGGSGALGRIERPESIFAPRYRLTTLGVIVCGLMIFGLGYTALEVGLTDACKAGGAELVSMWGHPDQSEGPLAFAEKRAPNWLPLEPT